MDSWQGGYERRIPQTLRRNALSWKAAVASGLAVNGRAAGGQVGNQRGETRYCCETEAGRHAPSGSATNVVVAARAPRKVIGTVGSSVGAVPNGGGAMPAQHNRPQPDDRSGEICWRVPAHRAARRRIRAVSQTDEWTERRKRAGLETRRAVKQGDKGVGAGARGTMHHASLTLHLAPCADTINAFHHASDPGRTWDRLPRSSEPSGGRIARRRCVLCLGPAHGRTQPNFSAHFPPPHAPSHSTPSPQYQASSERRAPARVDREKAYASTLSRLQIDWKSRSTLARPSVERGLGPLCHGGWLRADAYARQLRGQGAAVSAPWAGFKRCPREMSSGGGPCLAVPPTLLCPASWSEQFVVTRSMASVTSQRVCLKGDIAWHLQVAKPCFCRRMRIYFVNVRCERR
ncbi:hypothetical protein ANO11243_037170 [Dothideomycetidae sp. 11243]|nr:hypothetical protein ANO11243_037170 [fungal sp. No.11243]